LHIIFLWNFICSSTCTCLASLFQTPQNKRRREEEEYYASQQPGYVPPPPKKKWYQKFRRNKKSKSAEVNAYDGSDFSQMEDTTDDRSQGGWSTRSFGNY
jgi:hypothetical protein